MRRDLSENALAAGACDRAGADRLVAAGGISRLGRGVPLSRKRSRRHLPRVIGDIFSPHGSLCSPAGRPSKEMPMSWEEREDTTIYKVVVNHEEQYSIWPAHRENPLGWNDVGKSGPKDECLAYIKEVWTDMRPLSLRKKMEEMERERQASQSGQER